MPKPWGHSRAGYLDSIHFRDGATVSKNALLFVIDPRPYQAQLDQAKANLAGRKAAAVEAESVYRRLLAELPSRATAQEEVDVQEGNLPVAKAAVMQAEAAVRLAQLNLDCAEVRAPIGGGISRRLVDVGKPVSVDSTVLTLSLIHI